MRQEKRIDDMSEIKLHESITEERVIEAVERYNRTLENPGFCRLCGHENWGVEPDARNNPCERCGGSFVAGAQELMFEMIA
jgi:hypothetical protein